MLHRVALVHDPAAHYPVAPYHPHALFPELQVQLPQADLSPQPNRVYAAVRDAFRLLGLDAAYYGTPDWNPLGVYVRPGDNVVVKPNLVLHESGRLIGTNCLITQGSVIRPIVDYVYRALQGRGTILIADAPLQSARFDVICEANGLNAIRDYYRRTLGFEIRLADLRQVVAMTDDASGFIFDQKRLTGVPEGYAVIDLADQSAFERTSASFDFSRFAVSDYVPESTRVRHGPCRHEYVVANAILNADAVIAVPKLKVHEKVGLTACLKGMVGIVGSKDCLPHFRVGPPSKRGDEYTDDCRILASLWTYARSRVMRSIPFWLWRLLHMGGKRLMHWLVVVQQGFGAPTPSRGIKPIAGGAWYGNDTAWRMVADLNYIFLYATADGELHSQPQRRFLAVVDGIVAGEGAGPLHPTPKHLGLIVAGENGWAVDVACTGIIRMDWRKMPMLVNSAWRGEENGLVNGSDPRIEIVSNQLEFRSFESLVANAMPLLPSPGWVGHVENQPPRKAVVST